VVGVALAAIVALLAVQMARPGTPNVPVASQGPSSDTLTVWPDADTGAESWRADPEQVITRFSQTVLGWSTPDLTLRQLAGPLGDSEHLAGYDVRPEACPDTARCTPPLSVRTVELEPDLWSIQAITQPDLEVEVGVADPAAALTGGSRIRFDLNLADDRAGHIGMVASNGCREASAYDVGLDAGQHVLELPAVTPDDPACDDMGAGYLFAYAMDDTTVPTGNPLLEAAAIEYPWLTVIPIYLQMEEPDASSTATPQQPLGEGLDVSCLGTEISLGSDRVAAGPMGVAVSLEASEQSTRPTRVLIDDSWRPGTGSSVLPIPPGDHTIRCLLDGDIAGGSVSFQVEDPEGYWVDVDDLCTIGAMADFEPITVPEDDLVAGAMQLLGIDPDDGLMAYTYAGYRDSPVERTFIISREGEDHHRLVRFEADANGMWTSVDLADCI
jgi:hypothetical protein